MHSSEDDRPYIFSNGNNLEVNVMARVEFELAYYDVTDQHVNHYTTRNLP